MASRLQQVPVVQKTLDSPLIYINVAFASSASSGQAWDAAFIRDVTRSGAIVDRAEDYYVAVDRFDLPMTFFPLIDAPMREPCVNGLDTAASITLSYESPAGVVTDSAETYLRLPKQPASIVAPLPSPLPPSLDQYAFIYDLPTLCGMFNDAITRAWTDISAAVAAGSSSVVNYKELPSVGVSPQNRLVWTLPTYKLYDQSIPASTNGRITIWANLASFLYFRGLTVQLASPRAATTDAKFFYLRPLCDGTNYRNAPDIAGGRQPADATNDSPMVQESTEDFPSNLGAQSIQIVSDLPTTPEFISGLASSTAIANQRNVLTDFLTSDIPIAGNQSVAVYNGGGLGTLRFSKLVGTSPIQNFQLSAYWISATGRSYVMRGGQSAAGVKLCFARKELIEKEH